MNDRVGCLILLFAALPCRAGRIPPLLPLHAQAAAAAPLRDSRFVQRPGNVHPLVAGAHQLGPAEAGAPMERLILALRPRAGAGPALARRLAALYQPGSPQYHHWLTPAQFGARFGAAAEDLERAVSWLKAAGFRIDQVAAGRLAVVFSGTVEDVERTFQTPIRVLLVDGDAHCANVADPSIPLALADVVEGVVALHDLRLQSRDGGTAEPTIVPVGGAEASPSSHADLALSALEAVEGNRGKFTLGGERWLGAAEREFFRNLRLQAAAQGLAVGWD
jgi:hypothetical protein